MFVATVEQGVTLFDQILQVENDPASPESLVKEAAQGHTDVVNDIITRHPDQVTLNLHLYSQVKLQTCVIDLSIFFVLISELSLPFVIPMKSSWGSRDWHF